MPTSFLLLAEAYRFRANAYCYFELFIIPSIAPKHDTRQADSATPRLHCRDGVFSVTSSTVCTKLTLPFGIIASQLNLDLISNTWLKRDWVILNTTKSELEHKRGMSQICIHLDDFIFGRLQGKLPDPVDKLFVGSIVSFPSIYHPDTQLHQLKKDNIEKAWKWGIIFECNNVVSSMSPKHC